MLSSVGRPRFDLSSHLVLFLFYVFIIIFFFHLLPLISPPISNVTPFSRCCCMNNGFGTAYFFVNFHVHLDKLGLTWPSCQTCVSDLQRETSRAFSSWTQDESVFLTKLGYRKGSGIDLENNRQSLHRISENGLGSGFFFRIHLGMDFPLFPLMRF